MCDVPVLYATTEGQTRLIAEYVAARIAAHGMESQAMDVSSTEADRLDWSRVRGVCVAASLHGGRHQRRAVKFARARCHDLAMVPSLFLSVSLSAASKNANEVAAARRIADGFATETGWLPHHTACVAGRLAYSRYNWLVRLVMRRIAFKEGASGDTSRDHEYTDWARISALADDLVLAIRRTEQDHLKRLA